MLPWNGFFRKYLYGLGKVEDSSCLYGELEIDDTEHIFCKCKQLENMKIKLKIEISP